MYRDLEPYLDNIQRSVNSKFENYRQLFESTDDFYDVDNALNNLQKLSFSIKKFKLINDLMLASEGDKHSSGHEELIEALNIIVATYFYKDILSTFDDDYFFIQAGIQFIHRNLRENDSYEPDTNLKREVHLYYLSQLSINLAESFSDISTSYEEIELKKDSQKSYIEEMDEKLSNTMCSIREFSSISSRDDFISQTLIKVKNKHLGWLENSDNNYSVAQLNSDKLKGSISLELKDLALPDLLEVLNMYDNDIYDIIDSHGYMTWNGIKANILSGEKFQQLTTIMIDDFLRIFPEFS
jgi:hypothetical protein